MASPDRLILVDGTALIYRAYHAIPTHLATADGLPTNAIYGFATMFRKVLSGRRPKRGAVVFDAPGPTFRAEKYPEYKAQRPAMDERLRQQLPWIDRVVAAHRFPMLRIPGYEADDVIGTLTRQAIESGMEVFIVSGDKDFAQLVSDQVRLVDTLRDVVYGPELVRKRWGVAPEHFVDRLAMTGDPSDNIPGVPGIGPKGAAQLLADYGSLDALFDHLDELPARYRKRLTEHREQALLSRELAAIDVDVPLDTVISGGLDDLRLSLPSPEQLNPLFKELEFYSLIDNEAVGSTTEASTALGSGAPTSETKDAPAEYAACLTLEHLDAFLATLPLDAPVAIYPLIDAFLPVRGPLAGVAVCATAGRARWIPLNGLSGLGKAGVERMRPWLEDAERPKITHGTKNLRTCLLRVGIEVHGVVGDTQLESFLVEPTKLMPHGLGQITREYLQQTLPPPKQVLGAGKRQTLFTRVAAQRLTPWSCQRADAIARSWPLLRQRLEALELVGYFEQIDLPLASLLAAIELDGIAVNPSDLRVMGNDLRGQLAEIEEKIFTLAGSRFNVGSVQQLGQVLFEDLGLPVLKRIKSGYSTDVEVLTLLAPQHEIAGHVLEHRKLAKLI
ncbi:MAG: DNA polymerase, partial [Acidobacteriota bacterium]